MTTKVTVDGVSFGALPELCLFLLVTRDDKGKVCIGRTIYQKYDWQSFNAVRQNAKGSILDHTWIAVPEGQLVIPLE